MTIESNHQIKSKNRFLL